MLDKKDVFVKMTSESYPLASDFFWNAVLVCEYLEGGTIIDL